METGRSVVFAMRPVQLCGGPDRTRTCYPRLRRAVLYPDELRAREHIIAHSGSVDHCLLMAIAFTCFLFLHPQRTPLFVDLFGTINNRRNGG